MKRLNYLFILLVTLVVGTTISSCEKEECETCDVCTEIPTDIKDYESTILIRFKVPKEKSDVSVNFEGYVYEYDEFDADGMPLTEFVIKEFTVSETGVPGHYKDFIGASGEPVPGIQVLVEQEPNDDPVAYAIVHDDDDKIHITVEHLDPGTYQIRVTGPSGSSKAGFAVGGFNAT
jgi:hypothetical protein